MIHPGTYKHFKGGQYTVIAEARDTVTMEPVVVYRSHENDEVWVRPRAEWDDLVQNTEGEWVLRFTWFKD